MISIEKVDPKELRKVLRVLKTVEPTVTTDLRAKLRTSLAGVAKTVAAEVPREAPLSGLRKQNKWGWRPKGGSVGFTPGTSRVKNATSLVSIRVGYGSKKGTPFGVWIAEHARNSRSSKGAALIRGLNRRRPMQGKGGRYAYDKFRRLRPEVVKTATDILNTTLKTLAKKLR